MNKIHPITIWFTGLSASGKSTLSEKLFDDLKELGISNIELLDGDIVRDLIKNHNFDKDSRKRIGIQKANIAKELNKKGKVVLVSGITHKKEQREEIRKMIDNYYEVYLDCDLLDCSNRDYKGNYDKAFAGELKNFIGVDEPYEVSNTYDLILYTGRDNVEICSEILLSKVKEAIKF